MTLDLAQQVNLKTTLHEQESVSYSCVPNSSWAISQGDTLQCFGCKVDDRLVYSELICLYDMGHVFHNIT